MSFLIEKLDIIVDIVCIFISFKECLLEKESEYVHSDVEKIIYKKKEKEKENEPEFTYSSLKQFPVQLKSSLSEFLSVVLFICHRCSFGRYSWILPEFAYSSFEKGFSYFKHLLNKCEK